ncbi:helix-turn-helix domain-containing protein [Paenibacillus filicis]|uniref:Helix-turn-helix domain-containing protein n=1 Tax=Paenibacillus filicis TaxID=669464 RepID=A0ABU9DC83_9BACL
MPYQANVENLPEEYIKKFRIRSATASGKRLRQVDLAKLVGVDARTIQQWESGERTPSAPNLQKLVKVFWDEGIFQAEAGEQEAMLLWQSVKRYHDNKPGMFRTYPEFDRSWFQQLMSSPLGLARTETEPLAEPVRDGHTQEKERPGLRSLSFERRVQRAAGNLTLPLSSFIGRKQHVQEIHELLLRSPLVTLTGPGGSGKTSLALHAASALGSRYTDGIWLFEFASVSEPQLVIGSIMSTLGLEDRQGHSQLETVQDFVKEKNLLLIFDNCEHLIGACAHTAEALLAHAPAVTILATSQEPLSMSGEMLVRVPALSLPSASLRLEEMSREELIAYEAVQLFIDRTGSILPGFQVSERQAVLIAEICQRLEGNPLSLELAAARMNMLSLEQIKERLSDLLGFLTTGRRTAAPRQQTLKAAIDWSYSLLSDKEQLLLRLLSVFMGGFTLEAVEEVCVYSPTNHEPCALSKEDVLELLSHLVDKSLIATDWSGSSGQLRYELLAPIKQYAQEKLAECQLECHRLHGGDIGQNHRLHAEHYARLSGKMEQHYASGDEEAALEKIRCEYADLRAALQWACEQPERLNTGLRLAGSLIWFWVHEGHWNEGLLWLSRLLPSVRSGENPELAAKALHGRASLLQAQGQQQQAQAPDIVQG